MRIFCITLLMLCNYGVYSQNNKIVVGTIDTIHSKVLNETRTILVHTPLTQPDEFSTHPKYPVIYVLDGESLFHTVVAITEGLSGGSGNYMYPKMMVVGITNTNRTRDLTPTHSTSSLVMPAFLLTESGGGDKFISFIKSEVFPYINANYPASNYRVLIGHSFGGIMAIKALLDHTGLFNASIAIDPSMWWDNQRFLKYTKNLISKKDLSNVSLYVAIANMINKPLTIQTVRKDRNAHSLPVRSLLELDDHIKLNKKNNLIYKSKYYPDYDHGAVPTVAIYDALPVIFNFYPINFPFWSFFEPSNKNDDILVKHYKTVSAKMGFTVTPPGEFVNALAYQLMGTGQMERAKKFFLLNIENYPDSYKPYDAMGDFYNTQKNSVKAKEYFLIALSKKENKQTREKLEKLQ